MRHKAELRLAVISFVLLVLTLPSRAGTLTQTSDSVPGEVLVNIVSRSSDADIESIERLGDIDTSEHLANVRNGAIWRMRSRGKSTEALMTALQRNPNVAYVEPNYIVRAYATPDDPYYPNLYALRKILGAEQAWDVTTGSSSIVVGVIDTGIDYTHPDLAANVWSNPGGKGNAACAAGTHGYNALTRTCDPRDDYGHGTHVSGTIGGVGNNGLGVVGVNWTASIMGLKFLDAYGYGTVGGAIAAIDFAVQAKMDGVNLRVLSNSWGGFGFSKALLDAINKAAENDILFVASAGNDSTDNDLDPHYPSSYAASNVISVAATDSADGRASFSNFGLKSVHLGAPGVSILSTVPGSYASMSGTSMAAPHVAGAAALLLAQSPSLTTAQVKSAILSNTDPVYSLNGKTVTGGRLSLARMFGAPPAPGFSLAVTPANQTVVGGDSATFTITVTPDPGFTEPVRLTATGLPGSWSALFDPNQATTSSILTIWTTPGPGSSVALTVFGDSTRKRQAATATINVTAAPTTCVSFSLASERAAGDDANAVASADFNRDGRTDFVSADVARNRVAVAFGTAGTAAAPATMLPVGTAPLSVDTGDFNGDGKSDIVTANSGSDDVSVLIGGGNGSFQPAVSYAAGASPFAVVTADFNRDGRLDLVTANNAGSNVSILLGNGNGTFQAKVSYATASGPYALSVADVNRDGRADLLVANFNADNVSVLLGNGDGSFQAATHHAAGDSPSAIAAGDWNGDGRSDLAVASQSGHGSLLAGNGDGTFAASTSLPLFGASSVVAGDLNGDGKLDLAFAKASSGIASFIGRGDGTFAVGPPVTTSARFNQLLILDVTGDSKKDLVGASSDYYGVIAIHSNTSACERNCGVFAAALDYDAGSEPSGIVASDFNGDGKADLAVANANSNNASILLGGGDGTMQAAAHFAAGSAPHAIAAADFNRDGKPDLLVAGSSSNQVAFLAGNANGTFQPATFHGVGTTPEGMAVGDLDRDGRPDVVTANSASNDISILRANGDGAFAAHADFLAGTAPSAVAVGDVNRDGSLDIAVANSGSGNVSILLGDGSGGVATAVHYAAGSTPSSVALVDVNRDARLDLVVANRTSSNVSILLANADGSFQPHLTYAAGSTPSGVSLADLDADGNLDLVVALRASNEVATLRGRGDGTFGTAVARAMGSTPAAVTVADFNGDGKPDVATANATSNDVSVALDSCPVPDLTVTKFHAGTFVQGDAQRDYTITVSNVGNAATSGVVTVADTLPSGLQPVAMGGTGWTCSIFTVSCTRQDSLAPGATHPAITLTVRVTTGTATTVTNTVTVSGGGEANPGNSAAADPTSITPITDLVVASTHSGDFTRGDQGRKFTIVVRNGGGLPSNGTITVTDTLPAGLAATSIAGSGWTCNPATLTCQRGGSLAAGESAPPITVWFDIAPDAPLSAVNVASVSGGGQADTSNDVSYDRAVIWSRDTCGAMQPPARYSVPYGAFTLATGDFDGDGNADLVVGITDSSQGVAVLLGHADGSFSPPVMILVARPGAVRVADFDGDRLLDILLTRSGTGQVFIDVLRGQGDGSFAPPLTTQYSTAAYYPPSSIVVDDFNRDSSLDLVLNDGSSGYSTLSGRGDGTFNPPVRTSLSWELLPLTSADFNHDGDKDLVAIGSYSLAVLLGDGNGGFAAPVLALSSESVHAATVAEMNGDAHADLAVATYGSVFTLLGIGDGTFATPVRVSLPYGGSTRSIKTGSVNGDGKQDLIVGTSYDGQYLLTGDGTGGLNVWGHLEGYSDSGDFIAADFNHDGTLDLAKIGYFGINVYLGGCADLALTKTHTGNFRQGQSGATYTLKVKNLGPALSGNTVRVSDQLPAGLTATAISGSNWTCDVATVSCITTVTVPPGNFYPDVIVTVSVAADAAPTVVNLASVTTTADRTGANNSASDATNILPSPDLTLSKTHPGSFGRGQTATYTITVRNVGTAATTGSVQVAEIPPPGLTLVLMSGPGWSCLASTCSRVDILAPGAEFPPITVTATVAANAPLIITNVATVSTPGEGVTTNNSASDPTQVLWEPLNLSAVASSSTSLSVTWNPVAGATSYLVYRTDRFAADFAQIGTSVTTTFLDSSVEPGKAYLYRVRAANGPGVGQPSASDAATAITFTNDPIVANSTTVKAAHVAEIRAAVNAMRTLAGLPTVIFEESIESRGLVKASHIRELRSALDAARSAMALPAIPYIDPGLAGSFVIKASHIQQLRTGVK